MQNNIIEWIKKDYVYILLIGILLICFLLVVKSAQDYEQATYKYYTKFIEKCSCPFETDFNRMPEFKIDSSKINLKIGDGGEEEWMPK